MEKSFFALSKTNVMVEFRILGDSFDPSYVSQELAIEPSEVWSKGDEIRGKNIFRQCSCWTLSTGYKESMDVSEQLEEILNKLGGKKENLLSLKKQLNANFRIDIVINIENHEKPAIYLANRIIEFAYGIGAEFDFDLYIY